MRSKPVKYTEEMEAFLREIIPGHTRKEIISAFCERFDVTYNENNLKYFCKSREIYSGLDGRFKKGQTPAYVPPKGVIPSKLAPYMFAKGHNHNIRKPIGTERKTTSGYIEVKIAEGERWRPKHLLVWERAYGPVPDGYIIIFRDNNPDNCSLDNLMMISRAVNAVLNRNGLAECTGDYKEVAVHLAELKIARVSAEKRLKKK